jgi:diadenosine tetraphosphate (Ap4A) HIT family hydrolase
MSNFVSKKGVKYLSATGEIVECLFCKIIKREEEGSIVYEDDKFVVFKTIAPITHTHLLVTPRQHITNLHSPEMNGLFGAQLVKDMVEIGKKALGPEYADNAQYCFHVPPLNSIDHLHLHAIASPEQMSWLSASKYWQGTFYCESGEDAINRMLSNVGLSDFPEKSLK